MKDLTRFWSLVKKEFFSYINSPMAYVVIVPFLVISTFMYFRTALVIGDANLRPFIELLPWFLVVIGPALAMRAFADEYRKDTIELLFAHPVSEWTLAAAKFVGVLLFYGVMLLSTISLPISIITFANPDVGLMMAQYLGAFFLGAVFLSVGLAASAYIASSVGSFLVGAAINFGLMLIGLNFVVLAVPAPFNRILLELGVVQHVSNLSRGVLDVRDLLYFATVIGIALAATVLKLSARKVAEDAVERKKLWVIMGLIIGVGVAGNVLMLEYPVRADLTSNQRYSLSIGTKQLLRDLPDRVTITLYASDNLPGPMQVSLQETSDRLKDFRRYSDKLAVSTEVVGIDQASRSDAIQKGIREVQFNQVGAGSFQVQTGFLGLVLRYGNETEVIEFVDDAADLEYQLARLILKMTRDELPKLGVIEATLTPDLTALDAMLREQYEVETLDDASDASEREGLAALIIIDDGVEEQATAAAIIQEFLSTGGNVLALIDGVNVNQQSLVVSPSRSQMVKVAEDWGVTVNKNLVYDVQLNEPIALGQGSVQYILPYPFWVRALVNQGVTPWSGAASNVLVGWPSSLSVPLLSTENTSVQQLLVTGKTSGVQESGFTIQPNQLESLPPPDGEERVLGVLAQRDDQRLAMIGDTDIVRDNFLQNSAENQSLVVNLVDWVAADEILASIPKRTSERTVFTFSAASQAPIVQYGNILIPPMVVSGFGLWWLRRRKQLARRRYDAE